MATTASARVCSTSDFQTLSGALRFKSLPRDERLYVHYSAKAAWLGARIILRQVSLESEAIFDFIVQLYHVCSGNWEQLCVELEVSDNELTKFLEFAAVFLGNIGNFYGHGDQKFLPGITRDTLRRLSGASETTERLLEQLDPSIFTSQPSTIGLPGSNAQSAYYKTSVPITREEIAEITDVLVKSAIDPENTRIVKTTTGHHVTVDVLQGSVEQDPTPKIISDSPDRTIRLVRGDHSEELQRICKFLKKASDHTEDTTKRFYVSQICRSFQTGDLQAYKDSQRTWVRDRLTNVETVFGFVEPYRDPCGIRAEFEGIVGIENPDETAMLHRLGENADSFIGRLPWVKTSNGGDNMYDFEAPKVDVPSLISIGTIAYCSTLVFPGVNLPNYNDIRRESGSKNIMISNRLDGIPMAGDSAALTIHEATHGTFVEHRRHAYYLWVVFHELFGHGTGKLLQQFEDSTSNFNLKKAPMSLLTGEPIDTWYKPGETFTGVFQDMATSVDECRAECVGAYLMSEKDLLALCGYTDDGPVKPADLEYNMYQQLAIAGVRSLENYSVEEKQWGQAHSQGHFAMFQAIHKACNKIFEVRLDAGTKTLNVRVDRSLIDSAGKPALEDLLLQLHIYRCTADVLRCRALMDELTEPSPECLEWRRVLLESETSTRVFVQPNTFLEGDDAVLKDYEPSARGMIQSWAEREV